MYTFTHIYILIIMWVMWTLTIGGLIWTPKLWQAAEKYLCPIMQFFRSGFFIAFTYWSLIFLDSFVKIIFLGQLGYGNFGYFLAPLLLAFLTAIIFIIGCCFVAPTKQSLITFALLIGIYGYFFWFTGSDSLGEKDGLFMPLLYGFAFSIIINALAIGIRIVLKKNPIIEPPLWDISNKFKSFITPRIILLMWFLSCFEVVLLFEGYSFFALGTGPDLYVQIILDIGAMTVVGILLFIEFKHRKTPSKM